MADTRVPDKELPVGFVETAHGVRTGEVEFIWAKNSQEFLFSNSILIHGDKPVIVDPSASFSYLQQLADAHYVKIVLNTHCHGDHRSLNQLFGDAHFAAHVLDAPAIADFEEYARCASDEQESFYIQWIRDVFKKYKIVDCPVSIKFKDGDVIDTGTEKIRIIHIPGHTPGHVALYFEKADLLFVSDIDLTPYGPWYASPVSDIEKFQKSIELVRDFKCRWYVPSHGERIYDRERFLEKLARYENYFKTRDEKILEILKTGPQEIDQISSNGIVYKSLALSDPLKAYFQFHMVQKHLDLLEKQGFVTKTANRYSLA